MSEFPGFSKVVPHYCLRCQAFLDFYNDDDPSCDECGLQFDPENPATFVQSRIYLWWKYWLPGFFLAVVSGIISYAVCLQTGELGIALFVAVPISVGAIIGYGTHPNIWLSLLWGVIAVPAIVLPLVSLNFAGFFCGLTVGLIFFVPVLFGAIMGLILRAVLARSKWDQRWFFPLVFIIALPYAVQAIECRLPRRTEVGTVRTELHVNATPQEAWNAIMFYEEVEHSPPWLLRLALPKPIRSVGNKEREGEIVRCVYDRGYLVKRISRREEDRLLAFEVVEQKLHFERDVTLLDGSFQITPSEDGSASIVVTTRYERHLSPAWLWQPIENEVVHALHEHVLEGMRRHAEQPSEAPYQPKIPRRHETQRVAKR